MKLSVLIADLCLGELSQLALSDIGVAGSRNDVHNRNIERLVNFANQGVLELYKEFPISVDVDSTFVTTTSTTDDTVDLPDDALYLMKVTKEDGTDIPIDDFDIEFRFKYGIYKDVYLKTVAINKYFVLGYIPDEGITVQFHYVRSPELLRFESTLPLPTAYEEAIRMFICYKAYSSTKTVTQVGDERLIYKKQYEDAVMKLKDKFDLQSDWVDYGRFIRKGFV
jgi:hypothetical protein